MAVVAAAVLVASHQLGSEENLAIDSSPLVRLLKKCMDQLPPSRLVRNNKLYFFNDASKRQPISSFVTVCTGAKVWFVAVWWLFFSLWIINALLFLTQNQVGILSPGSFHFSHDEGFDSEDDSDHYEDFDEDSDTGKSCKKNLSYNF